MTQKNNLDFREKTFEQLDREVEEAVRRERIGYIARIFVLVLILVCIMPDAFLYWFRFATPHFPKKYTEEIIDINKAPVQVDIDNQYYGKSFKYKTLENHGSYSLEKMAVYSVSGLLVDKNYFFWSNYIPNRRNLFSSIALIDIGLVWQDMANKDIRSCITYVSAKNSYGRALWPIIKRNNKCYAILDQYSKKLGSYHNVWNKMSHTHVIPANASIMHALLFAPKNKPLKMEGYLVDVYVDGKAVVMTSLSRDDTNKNARGGGACETMYVVKVQVGNKIYE